MVFGCVFVLVFAHSVLQFFNSIFRLLFFLLFRSIILLALCLTMLVVFYICSLIDFAGVILWAFVYFYASLCVDLLFNVMKLTIVRYFNMLNRVSSLITWFILFFRLLCHYDKIKNKCVYLLYYKL